MVEMELGKTFLPRIVPVDMIWKCKLKSGTYFYQDYESHSVYVHYLTCNIGTKTSSYFNNILQYLLAAQQKDDDVQSGQSGIILAFSTCNEN